MSNFGVNCGTSRDVATLSNLEYKQQIRKANLKDIYKTKNYKLRKGHNLTYTIYSRTF